VWAAPVGGVCQSAVRGRIVEPVRDAGESGVEGAVVRLDSPGRSLEFYTHSDGAFVFPDLPAGEYRLAVDKRGYVVTAGLPGILKLAAGGCVELTMRAQPDRRVYGLVTGADSKPAAGIRVLLQKPEYLGTTIPSGLIETYSDAAGRFAIRNVPAGLYYLGVNLDRPDVYSQPFGRVFYPGTPDPARAETIEIRNEGTVVEADLPLPPQESERTITGVVRWPDGRPAEGATLYIEDPRFPWLVGTIQAHADQNGLFTVKLFDGAPYRLHAVGPCTQVPDCRSAETVEIVPGVAPNPTLILNRPGHSSMAALAGAPGAGRAR